MPSGAIPTDDGSYHVAPREFWQEVQAGKRAQVFQTFQGA